MLNTFFHRSAAVFLAVAALFAGLESALGARAPFADDSSEIMLDEVQTSKSIVTKIQQALRKIGLYTGSVNGKVNEATKQAIRRYQKMHGMKVNGHISNNLANLLETGSKVDSLLERIDRTRRDNIRMAREALLSRPETQHLLKQNSNERANPTRNTQACFRDPNAECLLREAAESAKAIYKRKMRDWALGELLVAQTKAGLTQEAMTTTRRIQDPRLIMVALRNIAEAQAVAGRIEDAVTAAEIIPDPLRKSEAFATIAEIRAKTSKGDGSIIQIVTRLHETLKDVEDPLKQLFFLTRAATALFESGHRQKARLYLRESKRIFEKTVAKNANDTAIRYLAIAFADLEQPQQALSLLKDVRQASERTPVLVRTATAQARSGKTSHAIATATDISTLRYRAVALGRIAMAQAENGQVGRAWRTIHLALDAAEDIKLPFARSYAYSNITRALATIGASEGSESNAFNKASETIEKVADDRLRAHGLWLIANELERAGNVTAAKEVRARAERETNNIKSLLSKIWMLSDVAENHIKNNEEARADVILKKTIETAQSITNAWERTRALAKVSEIWLAIHAKEFRTAQRIP